MIIQRSDSLGKTPARVNRANGVIYINNQIWDALPLAQQKIILEHERGHFYEQTKDEIEADAYAIKHFAGTEKLSLKNLVETWHSNLDMNHEPHQIRFNEVVKKVLAFDYLHNNNEKAGKLFEKISLKKETEMDKKDIDKRIADFLASKKIKSIAELTILQRKALLAEFMLHPSTQAEIVRQTKQNTGFDGSSDESDFSFRNIGNAIKGAVNKGFDVINKGVNVASNVSSAILSVTAPIIGNIAAPFANALGIPLTAEQLSGMVQAANPWNLANGLIKADYSGGSASADTGGIAGNAQTQGSAFGVTLQQQQQLAQANALALQQQQQQQQLLLKTGSTTTTTTEKKILGLPIWAAVLIGVGIVGAIVAVIVLTRTKKTP